jgi:predicted nucleic acid-binding protein
VEAEERGGPETSFMTGRVFLDTNVLVYLYDQDAPEKQRKARAVLEGSLANTHFVISTQVLQEFWVTVSRKFSKFLPEDTAFAATWKLRAFSTVQVNSEMVFEAIVIEKRFRLSFWDALIIQAALASDCSLLLTEDLQHGFQIDSLTVVNPFR